MNTWAWQYLRTGNRQHAVKTSELTNYPMQTAICGCQVLGALPAVAKWHHDQEGLATREKCKQCTSILEREQPSV